MERLSEDEIAARLGALMPGAAALTRLTGGASMETWSFEAEGTPLILRRRAEVPDDHPGRSSRSHWRPR